MNPVQRFFRKYFLSTIGILLLFMILNVVLIVAICLAANHNMATPELSIRQLAGMVTETDGTIGAEPEIRDRLNEVDAWAMLLNEEGAVIWSEGMPEDLPCKYTAAQIAKFSRWYLEDYPVTIWEHPLGLFVVCYPPGSLQKYSFTMETEFLQTYIAGVGIEFVANVLLMLFLFWNNSRRIARAVQPILAGIGDMAHGRPVSLVELGELAEVNAELNRAGRQLQKKDTARSQWISGISHDIRTPLSIMLGYASEIEDNSVLPTEVQKQAGMIRRQGEKLRQLVIDLNLASKLEYSMQPMKKTLISPVELSRQVISDFVNDGLEERYSVEFHWPSHGEDLFIEGDYALLVRMLHNVIGNSMEHNPNGCSIAISVEVNPSACVFVLQDTGCGMEESLVARLNAEPAEQIMQNEQGEIVHGNGLKLVRQIIAAHNGRIHFSNVPPHGLAVIMELPVKKQS